MNGASAYIATTDAARVLFSSPTKTPPAGRRFRLVLIASDDGP